MSQTKTIKRLSTIAEDREHGLTKQDEIDWLIEVQESIPPNSYLKSLFSHPMVQWVARSISDDVSPNLYAAVTVAQKQRDEFASDAAQLQNRLAATEAKLHQFKNELPEFQKAIATVLNLQICNPTSEVVVANIERLERAYAQTREDREKMSEMYGSLMDELNQAHEELADAEQTILTLKARLFDLIDGK